LFFCQGEIKVLFKSRKNIEFEPKNKEILSKNRRLAIKIYRFLPKTKGLAKKKEKLSTKG
jgi:hypothetical protein